MNREIKFRGKRIDSGEWVYGCLTRYSEEKSYITVDLIEGEVYKVYTKTVGQYVKWTDKKGKDIFEGDILKVWVANVLQVGVYIVDSIEELFLKFGTEDSYLRFTSVEVVGNEHDNNTNVKTIGNFSEKKNNTDDILDKEITEEDYQFTEKGFDLKHELNTR